MSVINKMLRDLDRRQTDPTATQAQGQQPLRSGTQSLGTGAPHDDLAHGGIARWWGAALLVLLLAGAYGLWWVSRPNGQTVPSGSTGVAVTSMAPTLVPILAPPMASASVPLTAAVSEVRVTPGPASSPMPAATVGPVVRPSLVSKPSSPVKKDQRPQSVAAGVTPTPAQTTPDHAALPVPPSALPDATVKSQSQSQVAMDALAHAQVQWADGDQAGALQVVQGVIAQFEKSPASDTLALATAVREYVRMTLAQQRPADALAMLVRLESPLAKVADIWALRGNTAQRLGLHAQAVHAYLNALELQPGQARWLLAAAVSMAAQGQTVPAAELAEKARRGGFLPPDVANYLQQLGVALRKP